MSGYLRRGGRPFFPVGVNYWPRQTGLFMWRNWDADSVQADLKQMKDFGFTVFRSFLLTPDFMPRPGEMSRVMMERLGQFLDLCKGVDLQTSLTLFVGQMSGENWDIPWRGDRDFYSDPWMLEQERAYVSQIVRQFATHAAIFSWVLTNEIPLYAGEADNAVLVSWLRALVGAVRALDTAHPIGIGDGALKGLGVQVGLQSPEASSLVDYVDVHVYPQETDALRHSYMISASIRAQDKGKPVVLEEFGCSTTFASEESQAGYFRTSLHSALASGGAGAFGWCLCDIDLPTQRPYSHKPAEMKFGIIRSDGTAKAAARVMAEFADLVKRLDLQRFAVPHPLARIVVPSAHNTQYPFSKSAWSPDASRVLAQSYVLARQAGVPTGFLYEPAVPVGLHAPVVVDYRWEIPDEVALLLVPATHALTSPGWQALETWVRDGGTLYCSYHPRLAVPNFETLFGCRHQLRYGVPALPEARIELTLKRRFGSLSAGDNLSYAVAGDVGEIGFCPVEPTTAEVVAQDAVGRPALLLNRLDAGKVLFATYPLELYLSRTPQVPRSDATYRLYQGAMAVAGIQPTFLFTHPFVECSWMDGETDSLVWLINHSWEQVEGTLITPSAAPAIHDVMADQLATTRFMMEPKEVRVLKVST